MLHRWTLTWGLLGLALALGIGCETPTSSSAANPVNTLTINGTKQTVEHATLYGYGTTELELTTAGISLDSQGGWLWGTNGTEFGLQFISPPTQYDGHYTSSGYSEGQVTIAYGWKYTDGVQKALLSESRLISSVDMTIQVSGSTLKAQGTMTTAAAETISFQYEGPFSRITSP